MPRGAAKLIQRHAALLKDGIRYANHQSYDGTLSLSTHRPLLIGLGGLNRDEVTREKTAR